MIEPNENNEMNNVNEIPVDGTYSFSYRKPEEPAKPVSEDPRLYTAEEAGHAEQPSAPRPEENTYSYQRPIYSSQSEGTRFAGNPYGASQFGGTRYAASGDTGYSYQAPRQDASAYAPPYRSYTASTASAPVKPQKKKAKWKTVLALALSVIVLGSAAGVGSYFIAKSADKSRDSSAMKEQVPPPEEIDAPDKPEAQAPAKDEALAAKKEPSGKPITTFTGPGQEMTPTEIYNNYVNACVGVSTEITTTNFFGQVTSSPVSGSGFIISPDGLIVTNCHVVDKGTEFEVSLYDGSSYPAELLGKDSAGDVALLKVTADREFDYVVMGDMDECHVGESVCVIGNPLGELTFTLTTGSLSALDRTINTDGSYQNMFQLDAAINSGNSGGPVFNSRGEVIGVATAKYAASGVEGLAFALPIDDVLEEINDISVYGYVTGRAYMGIFYRNIDSAYAYYYNMPAGVYVESTDEGGCAEKAGLLHGDIITAIEGIEVASGAQLKAEIAKFSAGDTVTLSVYRNNETIEIKITFDELIPEVVEEATEKANEKANTAPQY